MRRKISEEKEKIPLMAIYRHDGKLHLQINEREASIFELYGFLEIYMEGLREELIESMQYDKNSSN